MHSNLVCFGHIDFSWRIVCNSHIYMFALSIELHIHMCTRQYVPHPQLLKKTPVENAVSSGPRRKTTATHGDKATNAAQNERHCPKWDGQVIGVWFDSVCARCIYYIYIYLLGGSGSAMLGTLDFQLKQLSQVNY